ncbi:MAG: signal peptidase I [Clostridiaceae bacterium]|nr:signal peptidase I [Clostridiaceae bacterium]
MEKTEKKSSKLIEFFKWVETFVIAILVALLIRGFVFEPVIVRGISMEDTLLDNQRLIIYKLGYFFKPPKRGDIIVLQYEKKIIESIPFLSKLDFLNRVLPSPYEVDFIKRVIGVPGDIINIENGYVYINDEKLDESYIKGLTYENVISFPIEVPPGNVFVLGDNRENSRDSRTFGFIEFNRIKGKAVLRVWPFKDWGTIK